MLWISLAARNSTLCTVCTDLKLQNKRDVFRLQAVRAAIMQQKKMFFSDMPTNEEARLAECQHLNTFTSVQLISYAYNEALDLDDLLAACQRREVLEQACAGVTPALMRKISGSLQQLQEALLQEDMVQLSEPAGDEAGIQQESMTANTQNTILPYTPGAQTVHLNTLWGGSRGC